MLDMVNNDSRYDGDMGFRSLLCMHDLALAVEYPGSPDLRGRVALLDGCFRNDIAILREVLSIAGPLVPAVEVVAAAAVDG
jgi:hypothetical protein